MAVDFSRVEYAPRDWTQPVLPPQTLEGCKYIITSVIELRNGNLASSETVVRIWDQVSGHCIHALKNPKYNGYVAKVIELKDGKLAALSGTTICIWDIHMRIGRRQSQEDRCVQFLRIPTKRRDIIEPKRHALLRPMHGSPLSEDEIRDDIRDIIALRGDRLASISTDSTIRVWDTVSGRCLQTFNINLIEFSDRLRLAVGSCKHTFRNENLIELRDGNLASGSYDKTIRIWDPDSGRCLQTFRNAHYIKNLIELRDGNLAGYQGCNVYVFNRTSGQCLHPLRGHKKRVLNLIELQMVSLLAGLMVRSVYGIFIR